MLLQCYGRLVNKWTARNKSRISYTYGICLSRSLGFSVIGQGRGDKTINDQKISSATKNPRQKIRHKKFHPRKFDGFKKTDFPPIWFTAKLPKGALRYDKTYEIFAEEKEWRSLENAERYFDSLSKKFVTDSLSDKVIVALSGATILLLIDSYVCGCFSLPLMGPVWLWVTVWMFYLFATYLRRRSQVINLFFNEKTGVITLRTLNLGLTPNGNTFINILPDFTDFEMSSKIEDLIQKGSILSTPPISVHDKRAAEILPNKELGNLRTKVSLITGSEVGTVHTFIVLKAVDLSSPFGPIPAHLLWMDKLSYDGIVKKIKENEDLFRESKFGAKLLDLHCK